MPRVLSEAEQGLLHAPWKTHTSGLLCWFGSLKAVLGRQAGAGSESRTSRTYWSGPHWKCYGEKPSACGIPKWFRRRRTRGSGKLVTCVCEEKGGTALFARCWHGRLPGTMLVASVEFPLVVMSSYTLDSIVP